MISNLSSHLFQDMDNNYEAMKTAVMAVVAAHFRCSGRQGQPRPGL